MMKANSPTWVSEKPDWTAIFRGCPESSTPKLPNNTCPPSTNSVRMRIGKIYCQMTIGATIMPTETKKTAAKRSLTGCTS